MSKSMPMEVMKVVTDAMEELADRLREVANIEELHIQLSTSDDPKYSVPFSVKQHPENAEEFILVFE